jgi:hypothetical protein
MCSALSPTGRCLLAQSVGTKGPGQPHIWWKTGVCGVKVVGEAVSFLGGVSHSAGYRVRHC